MEKGYTKASNVNPMQKTKPRPGNLTVLQCKISPHTTVKEELNIYLYIFKFRFAFLCGDASQTTVICKNCKIYAWRTFVARVSGQLLPTWGKCSNFAVHKKRIRASSAMPSLCLRCGSALLAEEEQRNNMRTATALACINIFYFRKKSSCREQIQ